MFKSLDIWLPGHLRRVPRPRVSDVTDVMLAVCDHFEPLHNADKATAIARIQRWQREFPPLIEPFCDAEGVRPRHTFFYPIEQYDADILNELAKLCKLCAGEVEIHLHHEHDTADSLRVKLEAGKKALACHGLLAHDAAGGIRYGFIHGNWALANANPHGDACGVNDELTILRETGCYGDFTLPAAPDSSQTRISNSIYYAATTGQPKPHNTGVLASVNQRPETRDQRLLLVQGPLGLNWYRRKFGLLPRIENGELTGANPPCPHRMKIWTDLGIRVQGRPEWIFVKLHTHAGSERDMATVLGEPMKQFFKHLVTKYNDGRRFRLHFVSAREMVNIIHAAEDGKTGNPGQFRDYLFQRA